MYPKRESCRSRVQSPAGAPTTICRLLLSRKFSNLARYTMGFNSLVRGSRSGLFARRLLDGHGEENSKRVGTTMQRRFTRRRTLIVAAVTVALSIGIVFASVPYLPHPPPPHGTLKLPVTRTVGGGNRTHPGYFALLLPGVYNNQTFQLAVNVTGGGADFCVLQPPLFDSWVASYSTTSNPGSTFPSSICIPQELMGIVQTVISFQPPTSGSYDVAVLNPNPQGVTVVFSPSI